MRSKSAWMGVVSVLALMAAGCGPQKPDTSIVKSVIETHYSTHPECLWVTPVQFPATLHANNSMLASPGHTLRYDVLTNAGLLSRTEQPAKRGVPHSEPMDVYALSPQGRTAWTPDPSQPGYGNFCFGHREVTSVNNLTMRKQSGVVTASVSYQYDLAGVPDWAKSSQIEMAFPNVRGALAGPRNAQADLIKNGNGWEFKQGS